MSRNHNENPVPGLTELMTRYLQRHAESAAYGFACAESTGEVVPYDPIPAQPADPRTAWTDGLAVLGHFKIESNLKALTPPTEWPELVSRTEPVMALAFAVANYPRAVRNLTPLLSQNDIASLRPGDSSSAMESRPMAECGTADAASTLISVGTLRLAKQFDTAADLLGRLMTNTPTDCEAAVANEWAALQWHRGNAEEAARLWGCQADSVPVWFNCGMAALFCNRFADARTWLDRAVRHLPEESAWHHLGKLYSAVADMRAS